MTLLTRRAVLPLLAGAAPIFGRSMPSCAAQTKAPVVATSRVAVEVVARGLEHPWALQVLPSGEMLVTERPGRLRVVSPTGQLSKPVEGVPKAWPNGQGGLLDVALQPDFARSGRLVLSYAEARSGSSGGTAVATAQFIRQGDGGRLEDVNVIFRQEPNSGAGLHFGCRLAFAPDGTLFVTLGERGRKEAAQDLASHYGKVVRLNLDGTIPADNPFMREPGARKEIWSYGHRNPQSAAIHPLSGKLWTIEHGPRGGDEINIPLKGKNYGWPVIGFGIDYSGTRLHDDTKREGLEQPVYYWAPSIAPSGMAFYTANRFSDWTGNLLVGALAGQALHRLVLAGEEVIGEEVLLADLRERIRDVRQSPDGSVMLLTDANAGKLLRLLPKLT